MSGCDRYHLMTEESPRFKQLFAHLTRAASEAELDALMTGYTNHGDMERIGCPTLLAVGEYDPRSPLEEVYELYDQLRVPKELWVFADQHHMLSLGGPAQGVLWLNDSFTLAIDWLRDRLEDRPLAHDGEVVRVEPGGGSPNGTATVGRRHWYDG
jgi:pimeloyl-ACP methyl ester carboxylesterase